ncbi:hypothetical protein [Cellulomonas uda]|uniref:Uncharacterized protein n=1 Tax=Cellulomonas uda TaxID=1714 RepID=A0A4Y3KEE0_CELUD|nr:hypothetical protein [Cellulomonas uda]NII65571.1 hypothetical protein [Cellulomonas uda]GEA81395.1 hypothetical protein CUD01_18390 [Cellulomonas uda]
MRTLPEPDAWQDAVLDRIIEHLAATGAAFTADDAWDPMYGLDPGQVRPGELGAAFQRAHNRGAIRHVGYALSRRRARHGGLLRTWQGAVAA